MHISAIWNRKRITFYLINTIFVKKTLPLRILVCYFKLCNPLKQITCVEPILINNIEIPEGVFINFKKSDSRQWFFKKVTLYGCFIVKRKRVYKQDYKDLGTDLVIKEIEFWLPISVHFEISGMYELVLRKLLIN